MALTKSDIENIKDALKPNFDDIKRGIELNHDELQLVKQATLENREDILELKKNLKRMDSKLDIFRYQIEYNSNQIKTVKSIST